VPKPLKRREFIRRLREHGFEGPYNGSRHQFMAKGSLKLRIPNPHKGDISGALIGEILRRAGIELMNWD
jgi:predicted RNA binding protein YcfA (HicA-like mRNA interferase family)